MSPVPGANASRRRGVALFIASLGLALSVAGPARAGDEASPHPRLVLVLSIDQLRADRFSRELPGGLGRLARQGRVFADAAHDHADTETCPGHAVMLTGAHPGRAGVPSNEWIDHETGQSHYCVEDASESGRLLAAAAPPVDAQGRPFGRSPRSIRVDALGDWMKRADPKARVFALSGKDRAAITLGGQHPDAVYWFDEKHAQGFTSSRYYEETLPAWVVAWHGRDPLVDGWLHDLPERWEHATGSPANGARPDDFEGERVDREHTPPWFTRTSPHPLRGPELAPTLARLYFTPWLDTATLSFARALVEHEGLGRDEHADLLAVSLSATDLVGHAYGPGSQEARDALARLDADLGRFLDFLGERVGKDRLLIALTADHGVLELPEALTATGQNECPTEARRILSSQLASALQAALNDRFGPVPPPVADDPTRPHVWALFEGFGIVVNRAAVAAREGLTVDVVVSAAREWLIAQSGVAYVFTAAEIEGGSGPEPFRTLNAHSRDPERSGDLVLLPKRDCLASPYPTGTSHGTPYLYDRAVPLVLAGPGVAAGLVRGRAAPVDIGPTLATILGISYPRDRDGVPLPVR
jgi:arylsulfatase A-like enzyme